MDEGCAGIETGVTASDRAMEVPQTFVPVTEIFPLPEPTVTLMLFVVDVPAHPVGSVQLYVTPATTGTEYVCVVPTHGAASPVIVPGCEGAAMGATASVEGADAPQLFDAVTETLPPPAPTVALMLAVVDVPVHPTGRLQL